MTEQRLHDCPEEPIYYEETLPYLLAWSFPVEGDIARIAYEKARRVLTWDALCLYNFLFEKGKNGGKEVLASEIEAGTRLTPSEQMEFLNELLETGYITVAPVFVDDILRFDNSINLWADPSHADIWARMVVASKTAQ